MSKQRKPVPPPGLPLTVDNAIPAKKLRNCQWCAFTSELEPVPYHKLKDGLRCPGSGQPPRAETGGPDHA